ncbi:hypothetical protein KUCAC02_017202 [Chaenocephalus aceratus]|uniref:Uncharacterized protein n=1 Tax=Chaenocephalus aceratus TaxID=36190 RepID=A0ACB9W0I9_CHAAC|nr:hypothetical protein KUCAC02_017202 [Chaenocephalus aceratus]
MLDRDADLTTFQRKKSSRSLESKAKLTWNFFEASHDKGAPDGIGGILKRSADRIVRLGEDVPHAITLFKKLKRLESTVEPFFVSEEEVEAKTEATLHTGVQYTTEQTPLSFYSISSSRRHDPPAIWAHLEPVLEMVKTKCPKVERLRFFSDGPATQYKQKGNFYFLSTEPFLVSKN